MSPEGQTHPSPAGTSSSGLLSRFCPPSPQLFLFYASCFPAFPIALDVWLIQCLCVWLDFGCLLSWAREVHGHPLKQLVLLATPVETELAVMRGFWRVKAREVGTRLREPPVNTVNPKPVKERREARLHGASLRSGCRSGKGTTLSDSYGNGKGSWTQKRVRSLFSYQP